MLAGWSTPTTTTSETTAIATATTVGATMIVSIGGFFVAAATWLMRRQALVPLRDPRLAESLAFENT